MACPRFHIYDETIPVVLGGMLLTRGYREGEATTTMFKRAEWRGVVPDVEQRDNPSADWLDVYLGEISESRRGVNALILDQGAGTAGVLRVSPQRAAGRDRFGCRGLWLRRHRVRDDPCR
jgi:hypothetical protein